MRASKNVTKALTTLNNYLAYNMYRDSCFPIQFVSYSENFKMLCCPWQPSAIRSGSRHGQTGRPPSAPLTKSWLVVARRSSLPWTWWHAVTWILSL